MSYMPYLDFKGTGETFGSMFYDKARVVRRKNPVPSTYSRCSSNRYDSLKNPSFCYKHNYRGIDNCTWKWKSFPR